MSVVLTIFFYLGGSLVPAALNLPDDGLLGAGGKVQVPAKVGIVQRGNAAHELFQHIFINAGAGEVQHFIEGGFDSSHVEGVVAFFVNGAYSLQLLIQRGKVGLDFMAQVLELLFGDFAVSAHGNEIAHPFLGSGNFALDCGGSGLVIVRVGLVALLEQPVGFQDGGFKWPMYLPSLCLSMVRSCSIKITEGCSKPSSLSIK
jgi:hypothetical protein